MIIGRSCKVLVSHNYLKTKTFIMGERKIYGPEYTINKNSQYKDNNQNLIKGQFDSFHDLNNDIREPAKVIILTGTRTLKVLVEKPGGWVGKFNILVFCKFLQNIFPYIMFTGTAFTYITQIPDCQKDTAVLN